MNNKDSSSVVQKKIEEHICSVKGYGSGNKTIENISFQFDGIDKNNKELIEIYCGLEKLSSGQIKKISNDVHKMIFFEMLSKETFLKRIIVVDNKIKDLLTFELHKSWLNKSIEFNKINVELFNLPEDLHEELINTKSKQSQRMK